MRGPFGMSRKDIFVIVVAFVTAAATGRSS